MHCGMPKVNIMVSQKYREKMSIASELTKRVIWACINTSDGKLRAKKTLVPVRKFREEIPSRSEDMKNFRYGTMNKAPGS